MGTSRCVSFGGRGGRCIAPRDDDPGRAQRSIVHGRPANLGGLRHARGADLPRHGGSRSLGKDLGLRSAAARGLPQRSGVRGRQQGLGAVDLRAVEARHAQGQRVQRLRVDRSPPGGPRASPLRAALRTPALGRSRRHGLGPAAVVLRRPRSLVLVFGRGRLRDRNLRVDSSPRADAPFPRDAQALAHRAPRAHPRARPSHPSQHLHHARGAHGGHLCAKREDSRLATARRDCRRRSLYDRRQRVLARHRLSLRPLRYRSRPVLRRQALPSARGLLRHHCRSHHHRTDRQPHRLSRADPRARRGRSCAALESQGPTSSASRFRHRLSACPRLSRRTALGVSAATALSQRGSRRVSLHHPRGLRAGRDRKTTHVSRPEPSWKRYRRDGVAARGLSPRT